MKILVTGCAGFIGYHFCRKMLDESSNVIGIDNISNYYDIELKKARLANLTHKSNFNFYQLDIQNTQDLQKVYDLHNFSHVSKPGKLITVPTLIREYLVEKSS